MKWIFLSMVFIIISCNQQNEDLSAEEIDQIKKDIIDCTNKHAQDLKNLNYPEIMTFYADIEDHIIFGDGYYWGDYKTVDGIWKDVSSAVKSGEEFGFYNHKVHVFSENVATCLVEYYSERIEANGDTIRGHGSYSFGLQKINGNWKAVTSNVTHNYNVYDENGEIRKWWLPYSPENINYGE